MDCIQVAGLCFCLDADLKIIAECINYKPFLVKDYDENNLLFKLKINHDLKCPQDFKKYRYFNEVGSYGIICNQNTYTLILKTTTNDCFLLSLNLERKIAFLNFELNNPFTIQVANDFIRFAFIYAAAFHQTVLLHASCIKQNNQGIAFLGPSGIGKSTHSSLWLKYISGTELLNDDQPAVRILKNKVIIFGTPWSGKTVCYKNIEVELCALIFLKQNVINSLTSTDYITTFTHLLSACSLTQSEKKSFEYITNTLAIIAMKVKGGVLENKPEKEAVELSCNFFKERWKCIE